MISRRTLLAAAAVLALENPRAAAQAQPAGPRNRQCLWIPTLDGQFCCGMIHRPAESKGKSPAALIIHDLVASKDQPHRIFVPLAEALAGIGHNALRFDLLGRGDSEGQSINVTPQRDLQNARDALAALQQLPDVDPRDITVIGMGWGGTLASYLAGESTAIKRVVLISSCPRDNETWQPKMEDFNGRSASDQLGALLAKEFYDGLADLTPRSQLKRNRQAVLMVYGTRDGAIRQDDYDECKNELSFADVNMKAATIDGADRNFMHHEAQHKAIEQIITWLKQQP